MLTVQSGPYAGFQCDNLVELLEHQRQTMETCPHRNLKREEGMSGSGLERKRWWRTRCTDCNKVVNDGSRTAVPDFNRQKQLAAEFLADLPDNCFVIEANHPEYGWYPVWHSITAKSKRQAQRQYEDLPNFKRPVRVRKFNRSNWS